MKKSVLLPVVTLCVTAVLLFGLSFGLNGTAAGNAQENHVKLLQMLLPESTDFVVEPYTGDDANIRSVHKSDNGYVIETVTYGYAGDITMLIGVSNKGTVTGVYIKDMSETFGLGKNALNDHVFLAQFLNTSGGVAIGTSGEDAFSGATGSADAETETYVDGISGATVTSKAIARSVNSSVGYVTGADANSGATSWGG